MVTPVIPVYAHMGGVKGPPQGHWTYRDWEDLPDDGNRYEIIEGVLYVSTAPSLFHQWIIQNFYTLVGFPAIQQKLAFAFLAPAGVLMPDCEPVQPDFVLVMAEHASIIYDRRIRGVPDLIAEVLSPGSVDYDEGVKLAVYTKAGVPEYVVIDPAEQLLRYYKLAAPGEYASPETFREGDSVTFACLPTLSISVSDLFAGAPDTSL